MTWFNVSVHKKSEGRHELLGLCRPPLLMEIYVAKRGSLGFTLLIGDSIVKRGGGEWRWPPGLSYHYLEVLAAHAYDVDAGAGFYPLYIRCGYELSSLDA